MQEKFSICFAILIILFTAVSTAFMVSRLVESIRSNQYYTEQLKLTEDLKQTNNRLEEKLYEMN